MKKFIEENRQRNLTTSIKYSGQQASQIEKSLSRVKGDLKFDEITWELGILEIRLKYARHRSQHVIEKAFQRADLFSIPETDVDSTTNALEKQALDHFPVGSSTTRTTISIGELLRLSSLKEIEQKSRRIHEMQNAFNERYDIIE